MRSSKPFPLVVSGPSGAGKTTVINKLLPQDELLRRSISVTTRRPREQEVNGEDYFFVPPEEFERQKAGNLLEWANVHGNLYGTPGDFVLEQLAAGYDVVLEIDVQGGLAVKKRFPEAVMVFILPPSPAELESRVRERGTEIEQAIRTRLENARAEITEAGKYDYLVINDQVETAVRRLASIVEAERCRHHRYTGEFESMKE